MSGSPFSALNVVSPRTNVVPLYSELPVFVVFDSLFPEEHPVITAMAINKETIKHKIFVFLIKNPLAVF